MNAVAEVIQTCRAHHLAGFVRAIKLARKRHGAGGIEMKFEVENLPRPYDNAYCADFLLFEDGVMMTAEITVPQQTVTTSLSCKLGEVMVTVENLDWSATNFHHDASVIPEARIRRWFDYWFDAADRRDASPAAEFGGIIHQLDVQYGLVSVDFGTAPADAMWDLLDVLRASGARQIRVTSADEWSRARCG